MYISEFVREVHKGQLYGSKDYYDYHLNVVQNKVSNKVYMSKLPDFEQRIASDVALLHDILEDTSYDVAKLAEKLVEIGYSSERIDHIILAVLCLTKQKGEDYNTYMTRVKSNPVAAFVKYYDSEANMEACIKQGDYERAKKYLKNMCELVEYTK